MWLLFILSVVGGLPRTLNQPRVPRERPLCLGVLSFFMFCQILHAHVMLGIFASVFLKDISLYFFSCNILSGFDIRAMLALDSQLGNVPLLMEYCIELILFISQSLGEFTNETVRPWGFLCWTFFFKLWICLIDRGLLRCFECNLRILSQGGVGKSGLPRQASRVAAGLDSFLNLGSSAHNLLCWAEPPLKAEQRACLPTLTGLCGVGS